MADGTAERSREHDLPQRRLRVVGEPVPSHGDGDAPRTGVGGELSHALRVAEERAEEIVARIEDVRAELALVRSDVGRWQASVVTLPRPGLVLRVAVGALGVVVLGLALWARSVDYALRVTSDTPTFLTLIADMAREPFTPQSPFLAGGSGTQHATPYMQALAFLWELVGGGTSPIAIGRFLALVGIVVFAFALLSVFLYVRRLAGTTAAWVSLPVLLGVFGPPHVIWASDMSLHAALYAGFFPQNVALGTTLLTLLALERRSTSSLVVACLLALVTMLVHPFTGVLLSVLATVASCRLALRGERGAAARAPIALGLGFAAGMLWPAYSLDRAFAETGMRGVVFVGLCVLAPFGALAVGARRHESKLSDVAARVAARLGSEDTAFKLAVVGAVGTVVVGAWEWALVQSSSRETARLAIYWVDERWRWPLLLVAGTVGIAGLARLWQRGRIEVPVWFVGCFALGALGAIGLPLPVWYRFLLLCQVPLAIGVAVVVADRRRPATTALVAATFALALGLKLVTLLHTPPTVSYFGQPLQPVWSLGSEIPPGPGLVATDPATAYFIPATTGHRVLTVHKGHVSSRRELAQSRDGYDLLRRYYAGGADWWEAGQEMWRRGVRYVVVQKQTTLEPKTLDDFIWQTAMLRTAAQRRGLGNYFYENNRVGTLLFDSRDFVVYRLDHRKLFGNGASR